MGGKGKGKTIPPPPPTKGYLDAENAAKKERRLRLEHEREARVCAARAKKEEERRQEQRRLAFERECLEHVRIPDNLWAGDILSREPVTEKTSFILQTFQDGINRRTSLNGSFQSCNAAHGTNLAVLIQALRNANGQLVPPARRAELGIKTISGESLNDTSLARPFVCAANLLLTGFAGANSTIAEQYALAETGRRDHIWGKQTIDCTSAAGRIPVILVGEMVDPEGKAAEYGEQFKRDIPLMTERSGVPEEDLQGIHEAQLWGERMNIRMVFVWDPEEPQNDDELQRLVEEIIRRIDEEQFKVVLSQDDRNHLSDEHISSLSGHVMSAFCCDREKTRTADGQTCRFNDIRVGRKRGNLRIFNEAILLGRSEDIARDGIQRYLYEGHRRGQQQANSVFKHVSSN